MGVAKPSTSELRKFGITFCLVFLFLSGWTYFRHHSLNIPLLVAAAFFLLSGILVPQVLKPVHKGWMALAQGLAWINTRIVLGVVYFLVFAPIGLFLRLMGNDILSEKFDRDAPSYWIKRQTSTLDKRRYEQMF